MTDLAAMLAKLRELEGERLTKDQMRAEIAAATARAERAEVQLAGCGVAALGYGGDCKQGDYGWSASFGDVMKLRQRAERAEALLREALKGGFWPKKDRESWYARVRDLFGGQA